MFGWLLLLFVSLPLIELALLLRVSQAIELGPTIALVLVTGVLGAALARREGFRTWMRVQADLAAGRMPTSEIVDALLILVAGVVLVTPGLITDAIGFALLIPPVRNALKRKVAKQFQSRIVMMHQGAPVDDGFVDVEVTAVRDASSENTLP